MTEGMESSESVPRRREKHWLSHETSQWVEHAQDIVSAAVAILLVLVAGGILVGGVVDFITTVGTVGLINGAVLFVDKVLLVLILVEIVHTVVLSLRAHQLVAQPFVVVGLVAVIRKILFVLGGQQKLDVTTLALYIGMIGVFVASLVAIEMLGSRRKRMTGGHSEESGLS